MAQIELSQPGLDKLNDSLDRLVASMNNVDKRLASLEKRRSVFEQIFGNQQTFNSLIKNINKINEEGVGGFVKVTKAIRDLAKAVSEIPPRSNFDKVVEQINALMSSAAKSSSAADISALENKLITPISQIFQKLKDVSIFADQIKESSLKNAVKIFDELNRIIRVTRDLKSADIIDLSDVEKHLIFPLKNIFKGIQEMQFIPIDRKDLDKAVDVSKSLLNIYKAVRDLKGVKQLDLAEVEVFLVIPLQRIFYSIAAINIAQIDPEVLQKPLLIIKRALSIVTSMSDLRNLKQLDIIEIDSLLITPLQQIFTSLAQLKTSSDGSLDIVSLTVQRLISTLKSISTLPKVDSQAVYKISQLIDGLVQTLLNLKQVQNALPGIGSLEVVAKVIANLGSGLRALSDVSKKIDKKDVDKLAKVFTSLTIAFKLISTFTSILPGDNAFAQLSKSFENLGKGFSTLSRSARFITPAVVVHIGKAFAQLIVVLKLISLGLSLVPGGKKLDQLSQILERLGNSFKSLSEFSRKSDSIGEQVTMLQQFVKAIAGALKSLKGIPDLSKFKDLPPILGAFVDISTKLSQTKPVKGQNFNGFRKTAREVVGSLNEFAKIKVSSQQLGAAALAIDALGKINLVKDLETALRKTDSIFDIIKRGFLTKVGFNIADLIFQSLFGGKGLASTTVNTVTRNIGAGVTGIFNGVIGLVKGSLFNVENLRSRLQSIGQDIRDVGERLFNFFNLGTLVNDPGFQAAIGFEALSSKVKAFGNLTEEQLKSAQAFANQIGIDYPLSANEALEATLNLSKAGLDLESTFQALPAAADLASSMDTANIDASSQIIIQATQSFKEFADGIPASFENASVAADIYARAANNSTASVEGLAQGVANVGAVASAFGLTLEETTATLGLFNDAGIRDAEAGTQLKTILTNITRDTPQTRAALAELGVTLTDNEGRFKDLNTIINELNHAMNDTKTVTVSNNNLSSEQRARLEAAQKAYAAASRQVLIYNDGLSTGALNDEKAAENAAKYQQVQANAAAVIAEITGSQADTERITAEITRSQSENFKSIQALAGSYGQAGLNILVSQDADAISGFIDEMNRLPSAAELSRILLDNLEGDVEQLTGSLDTLRVRGFLPLLSRVFRPLVKVGRLVVDFFNSLPDSVFEVASNVILLAASLTTFIGGALVGIGVLTQIGGVLLSVVSVLGSLPLLIPTIIAGIGGLVATFAVLAVTATVVIGAITALASVITAVFRVVEGNVGGAGDSFNRVKEVLGQIFNIIGQIVSTGINIVKMLFGADTNAEEVAFGERIANLLDRISEKLVTFRDKAAGFRDFINLFQGFLSANAAPGANFRADLAQQLFGTTDIATLSREQLHTINTYYDNLKDANSRAAEAFAKRPIAKILFGDDVTGQEIVATFNRIDSVLRRFKQAASDIGNGLIDVIFGKEGGQEQLTKGVANVASLITDALGRLTGIDFTQALLSFDTNNLSEGVENFVKAFIPSLRDSIVSNEGSITDILLRAVRALLPGSSLSSIFDAIGLENVANALKAPFDLIESLFRRVFGTIFDLLQGKSLSDALFENFGPTIKPVIAAFRAFGRVLDIFVGFVTDLVGSLFGGVVGTDPENNIISLVFQSIADVFTFLENGVIVPLQQAIPTIVRGISSVVSVLSTLATAFLSFLRSAGQPLLDFFSKLQSGAGGQGFIDAFSATLNNLASVIPGLIGGVVSGIGGLIGSDFLTQVGDQISQGDFQAALNTVGTELSNLVGRAIDIIPNFFGDSLTSVGTLVGSPFLEELGQQIKNGQFQDALDNLANEFIGLIGRAIDLIPTLIGTGLATLGQTIGSSVLVEAGNQIAGGAVLEGGATLANALISKIGSAVAQIPVLIGSGITTLGETIGSYVLTQAGSQMISGNITGGVLKLANGLISLIAKAITQIPSLLGTGIANLGSLLGSPVIEEAGNQMIANASVLTGVQVLADGLVAVLKDAISRIPGLLVNLGTEFGSPFLTKLGEALDPASGSLGAVIDTIANGIGDVIRAAVVLVPGLLLGADFTVLLNSLGNVRVGVDPIGLFLLNTLGGILSSIVTLPVETLVAIGDAIGDLVGAAGDNPAGALAVTIVLGAIGAFVARAQIMSLAATALSSLNSALTFFKSAIAPLIIPVLAVASAFLIFKNALDNLDDLLRGDFVSFIGDTLAGIGEDLLGIFGVKISAEEISASISTSFDLLRFSLEIGLRRLANSLAIGVRNIFDGLLSELDEGRARADQALGFVSTGTGDFFFRIVKNFEDGIDFNVIGQTLDEAAARGIDLTPLQRRLRTEFVAVMDAFRAEIPNLSELSDADFGNVIKTLVGTDALDDALLELDPVDIGPFLARAIQINPDAFANVDFSAMTTQLEFLAASRQLDPIEVQNIILQIPDELLSPEEKQRFLDRLKATLEFQADLLTAEEPIKLEVPVEPEVVVTPEGAATVAEDVKAVVEDAVTNSDTTVNPEVAVTPDVQFAGIETVEDAATFTQQLTNLNNQAVIAQQSITDLKTKSEEAAPVLSAYSTATLTSTVLATGAWVAHGVIVLFQTALIKANVDAIGASTNTLSVAVITAAPKIATGFQLMANQSISAIDRLINKVRELKQQVADTVGAIDALRNQDTSNLPTVPGAVPAEPRALGGDVFAGRLYEVAERGISELLRIGGRTFLIPGQNGTIIPPTPSAMSAPPISSQRGVSNISNRSISVTSNPTIQITIQGGAGGLTKDQIEEAARKGMERAGIENPIARQILIGGYA